jgi:hypothetical protein
MNTLTIADLSLSQDLDRAALATVVGAGYYEHLYNTYAYGSWSGYYGSEILADYYSNGKRYKSQIKWTRARTQYEYSYWNYYY